VLALHGSGEAGSDNLLHIQRSRLATSWADPVNQARYPCFVVAPQYPVGGTWQDGTGIIRPELAAANNIIDSLVHEFSIDTNRIYVTGLSDGGFGTWDLITRFPERFAAAVPMSAGWFGPSTSIIAKEPIWNFHGAVDEVVPVQMSRDIIGALHQLGRPVVYTHCHNNDCTGLPDSLIAMYVRSHADLFYTEYPTGGHDIWNQSYDYPFLFPWVFDKFRQMPGAITLTALKSYRTLQGVEPIQWRASTPTDSVEIQFSPDGGLTWQLVSASQPNTGSYLWNTQSVNNCAFGVLNVFLKNSDGHIYSYDQSNYFAVNNGTQGAPFARILNKDFFQENLVDKDTVTMLLLVGSSKPGPLSVRLSYSADGGAHFGQFDAYTTQGDTTSRIRMITVGPLPNSQNFVIRIEVSDGTTTSSDKTTAFIKNTPRTSGQMADHVAGGGDGVVAVNIVDRSRLTGHLYRVTFNDTLSAEKSYNVLDATLGVNVLQNGIGLDGKTEGPLFDGIRLEVKDFPQPTIDPVNTRWRIGAPTLINTSAYLPTILVGSQEVKGIPYGADYDVTFSDHVVDTSSAAFSDYPAIPVQFTVQNVTEHRRADFIFFDSDNNRQVSTFDEIYILEPDAQGKPQLRWGLTFAGSEPYTLPLPGDDFFLKILKPLTSKDVYEFRGIVSSVNTTSFPESPTLFQNYPNPFNPSTIIKYQLPRASHVTLKMFNMLGQEVATLVDAIEEPGYKVVRWNAGGVAGGVYFFRLTAGDFVQSKKLLLLK